MEPFDTCRFVFNAYRGNLGEAGQLTAKAIVGIAVSLMVIAIVIPIGLTQIGSATENTDNWGTQGAVIGTLLGVLLPVIVIVSIILKYVD